MVNRSTHLAVLCALSAIQTTKRSARTKVQVGSGALITQKRPTCLSKPPSADTRHLSRERGFQPRWAYIDEYWSSCSQHRGLQTRDMIGGSICANLAVKLCLSELHVCKLVYDVVNGGKFATRKVAFDRNPYRIDLKLRYGFTPHCSTTRESVVNGGSGTWVGSEGCSSLRAESQAWGPNDRQTGRLRV
jgi:hypothetical protein